MKIGELAKASGTAVETIRFYEREGLLPPPARSPANYRHYQPAHLERLRFIRRCRALDMALDEVRALLQARDQPPADCSGVNQVLDAHIAHVAARLAELQGLQQELLTLRQRCSAPGPDCGILAGLAEAEPGRKPLGAVHGPHEGGRTGKTKG
ncbi:Cd(II)/Pb(II)-responsive transcriptional regulator [Inhella proteolytica]|uniref:Cd(II)/Pb(II)-responsive transcriptional regulator n=1 Tax=Inhella proteolytica TaxID=2795029 RepID=A0A931NH39_9BURK|nr:Cd(II)/Pb(II)-responsive transcriptional regulator [Inhella proteolytica]MBH9577338.1 Cd(II)/Pb(II)-responsive transcriptional regulator [Inhella proteolytica]